MGAGGGVQRALSVSLARSLPAMDGSREQPPPHWFWTQGVVMPDQTALVRHRACLVAFEAGTPPSPAVLSVAQLHWWT